jgi:hypothetical protein
MSPARDDRLDEIRAAVDRLQAAGVDPTEDRIAAELHLSDAELRAMLRQLFSEGRRVDDDITVDDAHGPKPSD